MIGNLKHRPLVLTQQKSDAQVARELGIPSKTLYAWVAAYKADLVEPLAGSGHLKAAEQALRDLEEKNAILKSDAHLHQLMPIPELCRQNPGSCL
ncbi:MAG: hypothetical protein C7B46_14450 [Sulfobacillus benefaciens]|uniref:Transposase n=1 Tax=Sulfobacillus benefaciens TaxID=453960 RepID=A0A2T2XCZ6_9FIRM|nr:MAG: hypothetical protein C7B46_14450 [Sulfobacillus benefaciens]